MPSDIDHRELISTGARSPGQMRFRTTAAILLLAMVTGVMVVGALLTYWDEEGRLSIDARNTSTVIGQDVARNLELYGLSIQGAVEAAVNPRIMSMPTEMRQLVMFDRAAYASDLGKIMVIDDHGAPVVDSATTTPQGINYADREYFKVQRDNPNYGAYVSEPLVSRSTGHRIVALSRRFDKPDGTFGGVVVGTVHLDYFRKIFNQVHLPQGTSITLYRDDATVMMREPFNSSVGKRVRPAQLFDRIGDANDGEYQDAAPADGVDRLFHFQHVGAFPMVLNVGIATSDLTSRWQKVAVGISLVLVVMWGVVLFGLREDHRKNEVIKRSNALLTQMVQTDGLTGIANRRCLDETLGNEWARAARQSQPLSLLMIDADHFKAYNDTLGHAQGDEALKSLAACLSAAARRTGDLVARYGGEEFAVVLPNTDAAGAAAVARTIRDRIAALGIPHPTSAGGRFTVSVGIATMVPSGARTTATLVAAADGALYRSKKEGRDRATAHDETPTDLRLVA